MNRTEGWKNQAADRQNCLDKVFMVERVEGMNWIVAMNALHEPLYKDSDLRPPHRFISKGLRSYLDEWFLSRKYWWSVCERLISTLFLFYKSQEIHYYKNRFEIMSLAFHAVISSWRVTTKTRFIIYKVYTANRAKRCRVKWRRLASEICQLSYRPRKVKSWIRI